jgi:sugar phosphate isomerase/epimerase
MPFGLDCLDKAKEMREINAEFFYKLCRHAEDFGVDVCLENMPFLHLPISSVESIVGFVKEMGLSNFKVCLDTGHDMIWGNQPSKSVGVTGDLLACIHAHDNDGKNDYHQNPKTGVCDWVSFAKSLKESTYSGVFSLETSVEANDNKVETELREIELISTVKEIIKE